MLIPDNSELREIMPLDQVRYADHDSEICCFQAHDTFSVKPLEQFRHRDSRQFRIAHNVVLGVYLTRALEGGLRITPTGGGGHIMPPPPSISAPMRASATNFGGYLGPYSNFFWPKFWDRGSTPSRSKRVKFQKFYHFDRKEQSSGLSVLARSLL